MTPSYMPCRQLSCVVVFVFVVFVVVIVVVVFVVFVVVVVRLADRQPAPRLAVADWPRRRPAAEPAGTPPPSAPSCRC